MQTSDRSKSSITNFRRFPHVAVQIIVVSVELLLRTQYGVSGRPNRATRRLPHAEYMAPTAQTVLQHVL